MAKQNLSPSAEASTAPDEIAALSERLAALSTALDDEIAAVSERLAALKARKAEVRGAVVRHRMRDRLTDHMIATLKVAGLYSDGGCLYLDFKDPPSRCWVVIRTRDKRTRNYGLGTYRAVSLAAARLKRDALLARLDIPGAVDPIDEKRAARLAAKLDRVKDMTFQQCGETYIRTHEAGWRNDKHRWQWGQSLAAFVYPVFGDLPVQEVDVALVMRAVEPIWLTKTETASRVRGRIEKILDWATAAGYRSGDAPNPARWRGHLENLLPRKSKVAPVEHHAALPYTELPGFMAELAAQTSLSALALQLAILTASRTGEIISAKWDEVDLAARLWTIPAERMKAEREHRVPLSEPALAILATLQKLPASPFLFPADPRGKKPISNMAMLMTLRRMGHGDLTVHGRSTFSDWVAEKTGFPSEVREMALAHRVGNKVEEAYRRGDLFDKRRELMRVWGAYCTGPAPAGAIVPLIGAVTAA